VSLRAAIGAWRRPWMGPLGIGLIGCILLVIWGVLAPNGVLQGWLIAFVAIAGLSFGAIALLCIGELTGGRWREPANPVLRRAAATMPLVCLAFVPIALGLSFIFPWASGGSAPRDVTKLYLNGPLFWLRDGAGLLLLSLAALALIARWGGRLTAALTLALYALFADYTAFDWILSFTSHYTSTAFGAELAIQQLLSALALVLLFGPPRPTSEACDLGGLTLASALGLLYFEAMTLIIKWYGDQPDDAAWYLARTAGGWLWLAIIAVALGATLPVVALLFTDIRQSSRALRVVGASILLGLALRDGWLLAPSAVPAALPASLLALVALGGLFLGSSSWLVKRLTGGVSPHVA
jgi:hypothetical protein